MSATETPSPRTGLSHGAYRRVVAWAWVLLALIVLSGAAVRLTQSGLGCEDWPTCNEDRLTPEWAFHGWVEFGNRLLSIAVSLACVAAALLAYRRVPRRPDLIRLGWGLVAGVVAQVVLGGITVLLDLHPIVVSAHFLLSIVLLWNAQLLWVRAGSGPGRATLDVERGVHRLAIAVVALAGIVLISGTVVTGTGPNSGDARADRLALDLTSVTRVHSSLVWLLVAAVVLLALRTRFGDGTVGAVRTGARRLLVAVVAQGAIGYTQFALGVPGALVEVHILGSLVVWTLAMDVLLRCALRPPVEADHRDTAGEPAPPARGLAV